MNKHLVSWLFCALILLSCAIPATATSADITPAQNNTSTEGNDGMLAKLELTEDQMGFCPICGQTVKWTALGNGKGIGNLSLLKDLHMHYYFAEDSMTTADALQFLQMTEGCKACLHLNGKTIKMLGNLQITGGTLNILGDGTLDYQCTSNAPENAALFYACSTAEKKINIYGGSYASSTGKQIFSGNGGSYSTNTVVKLYGNTKFDGVVTLNQSQLSLFDSATVQRIEASNSASVRVDGNWAGSATVDYFADYTSTYISDYNGRSGGAFPGKLLLADGRQLVGENGKLRIVGERPSQSTPTEQPAEESFFSKIWQAITNFFADLFGSKQEENTDLSELATDRDRLWFAAPAPDTGVGFERCAVPIGNGYMGVTVFGGTESETLSISDKEMYNPRDKAPSGNGWGGNPPEGPNGEELMAMSSGGYANMCKAYIDFGHAFEKVSNYRMELLMKTAEAHVTYDYDGVTYERTYFASYPDNVTVMKLDASKSGKLTFTLRPEATYIRDYCTLPADQLGKTGQVVAIGDTSIVSGTLKGYNINYEAQFKVIPVGGTMRTGSNGTIIVENADSAVILLTVDTNYELTPWTLTNPDAQKLNPNLFPHDKVTKVINAAAAKTYEQLRQTHLEDYQALYCRVEMDLGGTPSVDTPTDQLMRSYREGEFDPFVDELLFKFGRYLLIACSRKGTLPANLQGVWNYYCSAAWGGAYVYNINLQMNYWSCFATNLAELVECNIDFFDAITPALQENADRYLNAVNATHKSAVGFGLNGIAVGAVGNPYRIPEIGYRVNNHSGPGTTAYTSDLFWQYYQFTKDEKLLEERIYPYLEGAATFLSKTLEDYDGKWLVSHSASPENNLYFEEPFITVGTMFDQMMVRESFVQALEAARLLGYTATDKPILADLEEKLTKLDPVNIGKNGHVKEYREEEYYGEYGLYEHHGMAQLVGVYPGTTITSQTDAWQDAAAVTATERGVNFSGHQASFKQLVWARLGDATNSYLIAQEHIVKYIRDNLLNTHAPFQIDGNFGYTAGVAEMLIQSHEGYIKVLPALPEQWNTGYYKGLTARGGFEVDVKWTDGSATEIVITSNAGEPCSLNHFRVSTATVADSKGNPVTFTVDNEDQITFATTEGETYTITGLQAKPAVAPVANLTITDGCNLSWTASADAVSYKIYRAVNDQATYELVAENVTETVYTYTPTDLKAGDQLILRVTAVNADGVESDGTRTITWIDPQN